MTSRLEQTLAEIGVAAFDRAFFREGVIYTPTGGTARTIRAQITPVRDEFEPGYDRGSRSTRRVRCCARNSATTGIDRVQQGDTVTADGIVYGVDSGTIGNDGITRLQLIRLSDVERGTANWRRT